LELVGKLGIALRTESAREVPDMARNKNLESMTVVLLGVFFVFMG
jgi:hypothetical protein